MTRIVRAYHILSDDGVPLGVFYPLDDTFPFPSKKPPVNVIQRVREPTEPLKLNHQAHAEMVRKVYRDAQGY